DEFSLIAKCELADAFRLCRSSCFDFRFLGFKWLGMYFFDKSLPMGLSLSCTKFEDFSKAIQWILINKMHVKHMSHILDDFMFFGNRDTNDCSQGLQAFMQLAQTINMPIKHEKTVQPTTLVELHGIQVNTKTMTLSVPPDKMHRALMLIDSLILASKASVHQIQSLCGTLNFFVKVFVGGRAFLRRLYDLTLGFTTKFQHVSLNSEAKKDLRMWRLLLNSFNSRPICPRIDWSTQTDFKFFTDACGFGYAAVLGDRWIQGRFPDHWKEV
ncbi:MAG: hypothetical protein GY705_19050, partial [Bacteroidetes bacterium]|nr:hypothetical protein [Bacteroidota bacterium]